MSAEKSKNEQVRDLINGLGAMAEMILIFYRDIILAGATPDEAYRITQAFISAALFGNSGQKNPES